jgi:uncharacterized membrane protein (DUF2068 family)
VPPAARPSAARGVRAIVVYKLVKAAAQLLSAPLVLLISLSRVAWLREASASMRHHAVSAFHVRLAERIGQLLDARVLHVTALALALDGLLSALEGWALHRGYRWAEWLIIVASGSPLPLELYELWVHRRLGRAALLAGNALIVGYLIARRRADHLAAQAVDSRDRSRP